MDIQEKLERRSEHVSGRENASQGAPNELQQLKTTPDQNPSHRNEHAQVASPQEQDPQQDSIWKDHSTLQSTEMMQEQILTCQEPAFAPRSEPSQVAHPQSQSPQHKNNFNDHARKSSTQTHASKHAKAKAN